MRSGTDIYRSTGELLQGSQKPAMADPDAAEVYSLTKYFLSVSPVLRVEDVQTEQDRPAPPYILEEEIGNTPVSR